MATKLKTDTVYTVQAHYSFGVFNIHHFHTHEEARMYIYGRKLTEPNAALFIVEKDGVYNGAIRLQTAEEFHAQK